MSDRVQTMVQLTKEIVDLLDQEATRRGLSRSALVREAVNEYLEAHRESAISRAIVQGYTRIPPGIPDEWGDLEAANDRAARETAQRLDAEEREAGLPPW